jgi:hypothetical protein
MLIKDYIVYLEQIIDELNKQDQNVDVEFLTCLDSIPIESVDSSETKSEISRLEYIVTESIEKDKMLEEEYKSDFIQQCVKLGMPVKTNIWNYDFVVEINLKSPHIKNGIFKFGINIPKSRLSRIEMVNINNYGRIKLNTNGIVSPKDVFVFIKKYIIDFN